MMTATKPLLAKTAADLMTRQVVTIPGEMSLQAAAHLLARARISGAPVVDAEGRCVGVLSAADFVSWAEKGEQAARRDAAPAHGYSEWQVFDYDTLPDDEVRRYMTADPVTAEPTATVGELARNMMDARIHRLIVVDRDGRPIGIVSSMDILAAVAFEATIE